MHVRARPTSANGSFGTRGHRLSEEPIGGREAAGPQPGIGEREEHDWGMVVAPLALDPPQEAGGAEGDSVRISGARRSNGLSSAWSDGREQDEPDERRGCEAPCAHGAQPT
jgi:hypothetical protein